MSYTVVDVEIHTWLKYREDVFMNCLTTNVTSVSQLSSQGPETILEEKAKRPYEPEVRGFWNRQYLLNITGPLLP